jgi:hypothetical protein
VRPARFERATSWFVGWCRGFDLRVFAPVAWVGLAWCGAFGSTLFTDCSLRHLQPRLGARSRAGRLLSAYPDVHGLGRADHRDARRAQRQALRTWHPLTMQDVLEYPAAGMTEAQILSEFPSLTSESIRAVLAFAAACERRLAPQRPDLAACGFSSTKT